MNVPHNLILELMLLEFELGHNFVEETKNICCVNDERTVDQSTKIIWLKKFWLA